MYVYENHKILSTVILKILKWNQKKKLLKISGFILDIFTTQTRWVHILIKLWYIIFSILDLEAFKMPQIVALFCADKILENVTL